MSIPGYKAMVQNFCKNTMPFASLNMLPGDYIDYTILHGLLCRQLVSSPLFLD